MGEPDREEGGQASLTRDNSAGNPNTGVDTWASTDAHVFGKLSAPKFFSLRQIPSVPCHALDCGKMKSQPMGTAAL
jgi:hypothetical protein